jgi:uncharacterized membrane protein YphA (DoxX/SURF4 family)
MDRSQGGSRGLHIGLWIAQAILALVFCVAGVMKLVTPMSELARTMSWATDVPVGLIRLIGVFELLGGLAMVVPVWTETWLVLTPLSGVCLALLMICAITFHLLRGEATAIVVPFILGALAVFVTWGRSLRAPFPAKSPPT